MKINVIAHPNAKKIRIEKDLLDTLHIYVNEPPIDGRANAAIINSLAKYFKTSRSNIILLNGQKSKIKVFEILI